MSARKVQSTRNYRLFERHSSENRPVNAKEHKGLLESMKKYGFLECFPIVVYRDANKKLIVKDGQHRLLFAEMLGLPVHYIEEETDFDIAIVNSTAKVWKLAHYAEKYAANGIADYVEGLRFSRQHGLSIGTGFALLSGTTSFNNVHDEFVSGAWRIKDAEWANAVAGIYAPMVEMQSALRNARFVEACMAVCRVKDFKPSRLIENAKRCREKLVAYSTREAYLDMLETIYNFGRRELVGLKAAATMTMKERNATTAAKLAKQAKQSKQKAEAA